MCVLDPKQVDWTQMHRDFLVGLNRVLFTLLLQGMSILPHHSQSIKQSLYARLTTYLGRTPITACVLFVGGASGHRGRLRGQKMMHRAEHMRRLLTERK